MCLTSLTNLSTQVDFHPIGRKTKTDFPRFAESARLVFASRSDWFIEVAVIVLIGQFHDSHYNTSLPRYFIPWPANKEGICKMASGFVFKSWAP